MRRAQTLFYFLLPLLTNVHTFSGPPFLRASSGREARLCVPQTMLPLVQHGQHLGTSLRAGFFDFLSPSDKLPKAAPQEDCAEQEQEKYADYEEEEKLYGPSVSSTPILPVALVPGERGKRGGFRVDYREVIAAVARASEFAAADGVMMQQIEFPLDAVDQGTTLVKRFEALLSLSEKIAQTLRLEGVRSIGEQITIRDNINPGGGGEYLDNEGLFGLTGQGSQGPVALIMLAGIDQNDLQQLEKIIYSNGKGGLGLSQGTRVLLINTGLDRITANQGVMGFGGASAFFRSFQPTYYVKQIGTGFYFKDYPFPGWSLWGLPLGGVGSDLSCVKEFPSKIAVWEAEQQIKALCRS